MRTMLFGGDRRTLFLARLFQKDGETDIWGLDGLGTESADLALAGNADIIVLPYPCFSGDKLRSPMSASSLGKAELLDICRGKKVFAGAPAEDFCEAAPKNGTKVFNYATEALLKDNAFLTAEGALGIALSDMPRSVRGAEILVIGCGRIGRELAVLLGGLGAKVTVAAMREESRIWARDRDFDFLPTNRICGGKLEKFSGVFNTVPSPVFGEKEIVRTDGDCILAELASLPGGIDGESARALGRRFVNAQGLPGKIAPISASEIIYREIKRILETEEI